MGLLAFNTESDSHLGKGFTPSCAVEETDANYVLHFDLPGVRKEDLKVEILNNVLSISGERKEERRGQKKEGYSMERFYGSFKRTFELPTNFKAEEVKANYQDGVLYVTIPKAALPKTRKVAIEEGSPATGVRPGLKTQQTDHSEKTLIDPEAASRSDVI